MSDDPVDSKVLGTDLLGDLQARGLVNQIAGDALEEHLQVSRTLYCGFDPTADSLHIGSLVPLLTLKRFQDAGHQPVALVGGATGLIGDPSFKAEERKLNSEATVGLWVDKLKHQVSQWIDFDCGTTSAKVVNNLDWIGEISLLDFLRDVGKHFSVNAMIQKESVKQRIDREGAGISYTEFTYMLLQSYDFVELNRHHECTVQIGGSDQWGNITGGIDLTRRMRQQRDLEPQAVFGLTLPLVTKSDGTKFGKTESGTIWLDANKTSPYAFYQFWISTADADVYLFLRYFTFLSIEEIETIEQKDARAEGRKSAQGILAAQVTELIHGAEGLQGAQRISEALFSNDYSTLSANDFAQLKMDGMPSVELDIEGKSLVDVLVAAELARGNKQAREFIRNGAVSVNGMAFKPSADDNQDNAFSVFEPLHQRYFILKRGKKNFCLLQAL